MEKPLSETPEPSNQSPLSPSPSPQDNKIRKSKSIKKSASKLTSVHRPSTSKTFKPISHSSPAASTEFTQKSDHKILDISSLNDPSLEPNLSTTENNHITSSLNDTSPPPSGLSEQLNDLEPGWPNESNELSQSSLEPILAQAPDNNNKSLSTVEKDNDQNNNNNLTYNLDNQESTISIENNETASDKNNVQDNNTDSRHDNNTFNDNTNNNDDVSATNDNTNDNNTPTDNNKNGSNSSLINTTSNSTRQDNDPSYNPESTSNTTNLSENNTAPRPPLVLNSKAIDQSKLAVSQSGTRSEKSKLYFCIYCKELKTKFAAHLITKHTDENEVRDFMYLQKKSKRRAQLIADIRNKGTFLHNTDPAYNKGQLIVARRLHINSTNTAEDFLPCRVCGNSYSKLSIRFHVEKCDPNKKTNQRKSRDILKSGRALAGNIHPVACKRLRDVIFPVLRAQDDEVKCIRYDKLIIKYGNKLCDSYTLPHQHDMIRAKLRLLGKFKLEMLKLEGDMTIQLQDLFVPRLFDRAIEAVKIVAHWDPDSGSYKTPATAQSLSALIKACCAMVKSEFIKTGDEQKEKQADRFLHLWKEEVPVTINKKALEDQTNLKRNKKTVLPSQADIKKLNDYLKNECEICLKKLNDDKQEFDRGTWIHLQECTLICIQLFNRRRAGEIERLTIDNYQNKKGIADDVDKKLLEKFSKNTQEYAKQFIRITLRGKLSRTVSLLLSPIMIGCIECILRFREAAGVIPDNKFIFCKPGENHLGKQYIRACPLMEKFAVDCGASMPRTLRGTNLRKHVATYASLLNIEECQVDKLANFLGHNKDIHKNIYRMPVPIAEITEVSKLLSLAIGDEVDEGEDDDTDEEEEEDEEVQLAKKIVQERKNKNEKAVQNKKRDGTQKTRNTEHKNDDDDNDDDDSDDDDDDDEDDDDDDDLIRELKSHNSNKRTTSSKEKVKRVRWSIAEKTAVIQHFGDLDKLKKLPTLEDCQKLIKSTPILKTRSAEKIKAWVANQRSAKKLK